jgi:hypothetical protein
VESGDNRTDPGEEAQLALADVVLYTLNTDARTPT